MLSKKYLGKIVGVLVFVLFIIFNSVDADIIDINQQPVNLLFDNTLYVGGSGSDNYTKIQYAIDNASNGDTVFVFDDSSPYYENIVVNKSIVFKGENKDTTVIDAKLKGIVVTVLADNVTISGFTLKRPKGPPLNDWESSLIDIFSSENVTVNDNIIQQNQLGTRAWYTGIQLRYSSYCYIRNNIISKEEATGGDVGIAIILGSTFNNVSGNEINGFCNGIHINKWTSNIRCKDNMIYGNYLHHDNIGVYNLDFRNNIIKNIITNNHDGVLFDGAEDCLISENTISYNYDDCGILFLAGSNNYVTFNNISYNKIGIQLISEDIFIINNNILYNTEIGVYSDFAYYNSISDNNFIQNKKNAYFDNVLSFKYVNTWSGNYWDEPRNRPYLIFGTGYFFIFTFPWINIDWYPAKEPYEIL